MMLPQTWVNTQQLYVEEKEYFRDPIHLTLFWTGYIFTRIPFEQCGDNSI